jgi:hypothetical protein
MNNLSHEWIKDQFLPYWIDWKFEQEIYRLPDDQYYASIIISLRQIDYELDLLPRQEDLQKLYKDHVQFGVETIRIQKKRNELAKKRQHFHNMISNPPTNMIVYGYCPRSECHGSIMFPHYKCGLCQQEICSLCGQSQNHPHQCDENIRLNFETVLRETKKCPTCTVPIFRIHGCSHMWCTQCHVGFDWDSGDVLFTIENYTEFENNHIQVHVNDLPSYENYGKFLNRYANMDKNLYMSAYTLLQTILALLKHYNPSPAHVIYRDLRIQYLTGEIDRTQFHTILGRREKKRLMKECVFSFLQFLIANLKRIINDSILQLQKSESFLSFSNHLYKRYDSINKIFDIPYLLQDIMNRFSHICDQSSSSSIGR